MAPLRGEALAALARRCDAIRRAVDAEFGGMPDGVFWDLLDDMARIHTAHPGATRLCRHCERPFVSLPPWNNDYCSPECGYRWAQHREAAA